MTTEIVGNKEGLLKCTLTRNPRGPGGGGGEQEGITEAEEKVSYYVGFITWMQASRNSIKGL